MNIDLFLNPHGETGLLLDRLPDSPPAGVIYDAQTRDLTIEIAGGATDPMHLNITVEEANTELLLLSQKIYLGALSEGRVGLTIEVPLYYLNDPYGGAFGQSSFAARRSMTRFEQFMKRCTAAQPIHREDLGDEDMLGSVLRGLNPQALEFVPELLRARLLEQRPQSDANLSILQNAGPSGMGNSNVRLQQKSRSDDTDRQD